MGLTTLPRDVVPLSWLALLRSAARSLVTGTDDTDAREQLRRGVAQALAIDHVFLISSARAGLRWLLDVVARRVPGGEVILTNYNFFAVMRAVEHAGLVPVLTDAANTWGEPDPAAVEARIGPRTAALLVAHHFGRPSNMDTWVELGRRHGLALIEDCAHAFGARFDGRSVGAFGMGGVFSLSLTKGFTGMAGGVVVTADPEIARILGPYEAVLPPLPRRAVVAAVLSAAGGKALLDTRLYPTLARTLPLFAPDASGADPLDRIMAEPPEPPGLRPPGAHALPGTFAQAALSHLPSVAGELAARRRAARVILSGGSWHRLELPSWETDRLSTALVIPVRTRPGERDPLRRYLLREGFDTRRDYLTAMNDDAATFPVTAHLVRDGLYLPMRALHHQPQVLALARALRGFDQST
jgi:hypothetical protein